MEVYYGENYWGEHENKMPMKKIELNKKFRWGDLEGLIPVLYVNEEGLAMDFCMRISDDKMNPFIEKWKAKFAEPMEEEEQMELIRENPLNVSFSANVFVNGKEVQSDFGCGASYSKKLFGVYKEQIGEAFEDKPKKDSVERQLIKAYDCDANGSWRFYRHMCRWDKLPETIETLEIDLIAEDIKYPARNFEVDLISKGQIYEIVSPVDGMKYQLEVLDIEQEELNTEHFPKSRESEQQLEFPTHYLTMLYETKEELSEKQFYIRDAGKSDTPRRIIQAENGASGVTMIGGSSGAISVFVASRKKDGEGRGRLAASSMHFEPVTSVLWKPVFLKKEREDIRIKMEKIKL